ncbi:lytic transglycosylase domain-containing protein [Roseomonas sp. CCTCC AB2023176]|uniref:lytic transglycosylase domain-containing protein n=1 Tax=Roseomonas sp. CCTCC AB2023176 TaxID=3342640 RepID=UPI0035D7DFCE
MLRLLALMLLSAGPVMGQVLPSPANPSPIARCRAAIATAEREAGIPAGLLQAIGRVESGRTDPATGEAGPWPWTVNVEGAGRFFPSAVEAIAHVRQARASGARSMDVGCMQINLLHHPNAFASLEDGFDPLANARYAARFLKELHGERGEWMAAAGNYHSRTPERAEAYRNAVASRLPEEQARAGSAPGWNAGWARLAAAPVTPPVAGFGSIRGAAAPVILRNPGSSGGGTTGRDLDSYRAMAIPLTARTPVARLLGGRG